MWGEVLDKKVHLELKLLKLSKEGFGRRSACGWAGNHLNSSITKFFNLYAHLCHFNFLSKEIIIIIYFRPSLFKHFYLVNKINYLFLYVFK